MGGADGSLKSPSARDAISSRANEARVLEIEAVDGRSRSYASMCVDRTPPQGDVRNPSTSPRPPWITALTRPAAKAPDETVCEVSFDSTPNTWHFGLRAKARNQSIRWKAFRVEAGSSLHWGGTSAALAMQVVSENVVERRRIRSFWRVRKHSLDESSVARSAA